MQPRNNRRSPSIGFLISLTINEEIWPQITGIAALNWREDSLLLRPQNQWSLGADIDSTAPSHNLSIIVDGVVAVLVWRIEYVELPFLSILKFIVNPNCKNLRFHHEITKLILRHSFPRYVGFSNIRMSFNENQYRNLTSVKPRKRQTEADWAKQRNRKRYR